MQRVRYAKLCLRDATTQSEQKFGSRLLEVYMLPIYVSYNAANRLGLKVATDISHLMYGPKNYFNGAIKKGTSGWN